MEPIAVELLMALAGGSAGAAGQQAWQTLHRLVMRRQAEGESEPPAVRELTAFAENPDSVERARELAEALLLRAQHDPVFAQALAAWKREAESTHTSSGDVHNEISGSTAHGTVIMGRDIHGTITFDGHTSPGPENDPDDDWPQEPPPGLGGTTGMTDEELTALAAAAGAVVVHMPELRQELARWVGRGDEQRERAVLSRLHQTASENAAADAIRAMLEDLSDLDREAVADALDQLLRRHGFASGLYGERGRGLSGPDNVVRGDQRNADIRGNNRSRVVGHTSPGPENDPDDDWPQES